MYPLQILAKPSGCGKSPQEDPCSRESWAKKPTYIGSTYTYSKHVVYWDVRSTSNFGRVRCFEGTFTLRKRGHFLKIKRALLCSLQNLGGNIPQYPTLFVQFKVLRFSKQQQQQQQTGSSYNLDISQFLKM